VLGWKTLLNGLLLNTFEKIVNFINKKLLWQGLKRGFLPPTGDQSHSFVPARRAGYFHAYAYIFLKAFGDTERWQVLAEYRL
jgi:hypothetical protein